MKCKHSKHCKELLKISAGQGKLNRGESKTGRKAHNLVNRAFNEKTRSRYGERRFNTTGFLQQSGLAIPMNGRHETGNTLT